MKVEIKNDYFSKVFKKARNCRKYLGKQYQGTFEILFGAQIKKENVTSSGVARGRRRPPMRQGRKSEYTLKYNNIVKKWPENASREVQRSKIFIGT